MASDSHPPGATRRVLLAGLPSLTLAVTALKPARAMQPPHRLAALAPRFFTDFERAFVTAAVDRLLPDDANGPGGVAAEVPRFIDLQLAGSWGRGDDRYVQGPEQAGPPGLGNQSIAPRAMFYRTSIAALHATPAGGSFVGADSAARDAFLTALQQGEHEGPDIQGMKFFATLLEDSISGFLADPSYGGNADFAGWKLIGYPGVRYDWTPYLRNDGRKLDMQVVGTFGPSGGYGVD